MSVHEGSMIELHLNFLFFTCKFIHEIDSLKLETQEEAQMTWNVNNPLIQPTHFHHISGRKHKKLTFYRSLNNDGK